MPRAPTKTKFAPDRLFLVVGSAYKADDVFNVHDLKRICEQAAITVIEEGTNIYLWRDLLGVKYSSLPGVRKLHDFLIVRLHNETIMMKVREKIYAQNNWCVTTYSTYINHQKTLTKEKLANIKLMYDRYIPPNYRQDYIMSYVYLLLCRGGSIEGSTSVVRAPLFHPAI